jgi:hypothetical protein
MFLNDACRDSAGVCSGGVARAQVMSPLVKCHSTVVGGGRKEKLSFYNFHAEIGHVQRHRHVFQVLLVICRQNKDF